MDTRIVTELNALHQRLMSAVAGRQWEEIPAILSEQKRFVESNLTNLSPEARQQILNHTGQVLLLAQVTRAQMQDTLSRNVVSLTILSAYQDGGQQQTFTSMG